ncbi:MAG: ATP-binding protein [Crocinitomicaceae bacterium]
MTKKRFNMSLAARNALVYFVLFAIAISLASSLLISYSHKEILRLTENRLDHSSEMIDIKFEAYFANVETDIDRLAKSPVLNKFVETPDSFNLQLLVAEYQSVLNAKPDYFQIRLISIADYGKEIIKIERKGKTIINTPASELQNKANRDYFKELLSLPIDSLYLSKIDLNREFKKVSIPKIPTVRMGKKLKGGAINDFIILININVKPLLINLKESLPENDELRVVNQDGHYILHPDSINEFTFDFDKTERFSSEFKQQIGDLIEKPDEANSKLALNRFSNLVFKRNNYQLYSIISANRNEVLASFYIWRKTVIILSVIIGLVFLAIGFVYMKRQVKELKSITEQMMEFSGNLGPKKLPIERQDEIGQMAREFEKMSSSISRSQSEIENAMAKAEQAHQEKTEFLENMSHEIRNPLQSILGAIDILNNNQQLPHQTSFIQSIQFSSNQLQSLANDILDFKKITSHEIELEPKWIDINQFCKDIYESSQFLAKSKQIEFTYTNRIKTDHVLAFIDPKRLYQILNNLITNALKFTENYGKVNLKVVELNSGIFQFKIADTGYGLTEKQQKQIMNRHYAEGKSAGAGLGLPIVQNLLIIYKSDLKIESSKDKGSRFSFELKLPFKQSIEEHKASEEQDVKVKNLDLLIIEDDPQIIKWYQHILEKNNLKFLTHPSQINQVENMSFDFIICDYNFGRTQLDLTAIKSTFESILKISGSLIIASGQVLKFEDRWISTLQKPLKKEDLFKILSSNKLELDIPSFASIEKDYDHQSDLIKNVLALLISEWEKDKKTVLGSISTQNLSEFDAIVHRLITSIRRLELMNFEILLKETQALFHSKNAINNYNAIKRSFDHYITEMKNYKNTIA